ncbi:hypothetical protein FACS1894105_04950 [Clostridia bacterium]|nr:hypothetical protein FACS1894105_04950 [Clostridia bacterium]
MSNTDQIAELTAAELYGSAIFGVYSNSTELFQLKATPSVTQVVSPPNTISRSGKTFTFTLTQEQIALLESTNNSEKLKIKELTAPAYHKETTTEYFLDPPDPTKVVAGVIPLTFSPDNTINNDLKKTVELRPIEKTGNGVYKAGATFEVRAGSTTGTKLLTITMSNTTTSGIGRIGLIKIVFETDTTGAIVTTHSSDTVTLENDGKNIANWSKNTLYLVEVTPPSGFVAAPAKELIRHKTVAPLQTGGKIFAATVWSFSTAADAEVTNSTSTIENKTDKAKIYFTKRETDVNGAVIPGRLFNLYDSSDNLIAANIITNSLGVFDVEITLGNVNADSFYFASGDGTAAEWEYETAYFPDTIDKWGLLNSSNFHLREISIPEKYKDISAVNIPLYVESIDGPGTLGERLITLTTDADHTSSTDTSYDGIIINELRKNLKINFKKIDSVSKKPIAGAKFEVTNGITPLAIIEMVGSGEAKFDVLFGDDDKVTGTPYKDADGNTITFEEAGKAYTAWSGTSIIFTLTETDPPFGYSLTTADYTLNSNTDRTFVTKLDYTPSIENVLESPNGRVRISIAKIIGGTTTPLGGAKFELYKSTTIFDSNTLVQHNGKNSFVIPTSGVLSIGAWIEKNVTYTLKEIEVPVGYVAPAKDFTFKVADPFNTTADPNVSKDAIGDFYYTVTVPNYTEDNDPSRGHIVITKVDTSGVALKGGAVFTITGPAGYDPNKQPADSTSNDYTTNNNGIITLKNLPFGEYTVTEKSPPSGYSYIGSDNNKTLTPPTWRVIIQANNEPDAAGFPQKRWHAAYTFRNEKFYDFAIKKSTTKNTTGTEYLPGAEFEIYRAPKILSDTIKINIPVSVGGARDGVNKLERVDLKQADGTPLPNNVYVSSEDFGTPKPNLIAGIYVAYETKPPVGYVGRSGPIIFAVGVDMPAIIPSNYDIFIVEDESGSNGYKFISVTNLVKSDKYAELVVKKRDSLTNEPIIDNTAEFGLYYDEACMYPVIVDNIEMKGMKLDKDGNVIFKDILIGKYYLKETIPPTDYDSYPNTNTWVTPIWAYVSHTIIDGIDSVNPENTTVLYNKRTIKTVDLPGILKVDGYTTAGLVGAEFELRNQDNEPLVVISLTDTASVPAVQVVWNDAGNRLNLDSAVSKYFGFTSLGDTFDGWYNATSFKLVETVAPTGYTETGLVRDNIAPTIRTLNRIVINGNNLVAGSYQFQVSNTNYTTIGTTGGGGGGDTTVTTTGGGTTGGSSGSSESSSTSGSSSSSTVPTTATGSTTGTTGTTEPFIETTTDSTQPTTASSTTEPTATVSAASTGSTESTSETDEELVDANDGRIPLGDGYFAEDLGDGRYLIYDGDEPIGYIQLEEGEEIEDLLDILDRLVPLAGFGDEDEAKDAKPNPKTGEAATPIIAAILAMISLGASVQMGRKVLRAKRK